MINRVIKLVIFLEIISTVAAQSPSDFTFYGLRSGAIAQYDRVGAFLRSFNACITSASNDATIGGDGKIWSGGSLLNYFDPETLECGGFNVSGSVSNTMASPRGRHIYYKSGKNIFRYNIALKKTEPVLIANSSFDYHAFGFVGSKFLVARSPNVYLQEYSVDSQDNLVGDASLVFTGNGYPQSIFKMKKCPSISPNLLCWQRFPQAPEVVKLLNITMLQSRNWLMVANQTVGDYWSAPWDQLYASLTDLPQLHAYRVSSYTTFPLSNFTKLREYNTSTSFNGFVALINPPQVSIGSDCQASFQFNSYVWTKRFAIQAQNQPGSVFEDFHVVSNPAEGPQNIQLPTICEGPAIRFRLYYEGNMSTSDPVFSMPITVSCSCQVPQAAPTAYVPPNVIPILECVERTDQGFTVHLGYNNTESSAVEIPIGNFNKFSDLDNRNQPTSFATGRSSFYPASSFSFAFSGSVTWILSTYALNIDTSDSKVWCPQNVSFAMSFTAQTEVTAQDIEDIRVGIAGLLNITSNRVNVLEWTSTPVNKKRATSVIEIRFRILSTQNVNEISAPEAVRTIIALMGQSPDTIDQVINTGSNTDRSVQSVNTMPNGVEQDGTSTSEPVGNDNAPQSISPASNNVIMFIPTVVATLALIVAC